MIQHDHLESAHTAHKGINDIIGGTVIGNIVSIIIGTTIIAVETWVNAGNVDTWASWLIKAGSAIVIYFGIKNGYLAMQKNKIELEKLKKENGLQ
jgi:hypothetical protein